MNIFENISTENIRKNWLNYKDEFYGSPYYKLLWNSLESKFEIDKNDVYLAIFKKFINNKEINYKKRLFSRIHINQIDTDTLVLKGLNGDERKHIHLLCDKIGLHHESKPHPKKKYKKSLYIYKPKLWLWEYTEKNPYSKSEEYYKTREIERQIKQQIKQQQLKEKLSKKYCCVCHENGWETELYCSVYFRGLYCNDCIETTSDGGGGTLSEHKFETLYE